MEVTPPRRPVPRSLMPLIGKTGNVAIKTTHKVLKNSAQESPQKICAKRFFNLRQTIFRKHSTSYRY